MIAYNRIWIKNLSLLKKAEYWFAKKLLSSEQFAIINSRYKTNFYTPALFVKIGLFIFTYIMIGAATSMYSVFILLFNQNVGDIFGTFTCLLFSTGCFITLEQLIKRKNLYRSGIDEALLYAGLGFLAGALCFMFGNVFYDSDINLFFYMLSLIILGITVARYADRLTSFLMAVCLYTVFFLLLLKLGEIAKMIMPFALMLLSAIIYVQAKKYKSKKNLIYWKSCIVVFECIALMVFYISCNYYVIRESSISFFDIRLAQGEDIPLAFIFYILTASVPIAYIHYGLKRKDKILLWIGLVLVPASAITFKYYFSLGHPEITLTLAGLIAILVAYISIKYLKTPKHGITFEEDKDEDHFLKTNAEALIIAQSFSQQGQNISQQDDVKLGGGDFGGAGAGNQF